MNKNHHNNNNNNSKLHSENRQDIVIWKRVSYNLKTLSSLRQECYDVENYIKDLTSQLESASPDATEKLSTKLAEALKKGRKCTSEMRSKVVKTKEDMDTLSKLGALGDHVNMADFNLFPDPISSRSSTSNPRNSLSGPSVQKPIIPIGALVAARTLEPNETVDVWILATVIHYYADRNKYQVEDVEADESDGENHKYILSARFVLQLPNDRDLSYDNELKIGQEVLALYPNTSCFYKAIVLSTPSKNKARSHHSQDYAVHFDDDDEEKRFVSRKMVVQMPVIQRSR